MSADLTILTTADAAPDVMQQFAHSVSCIDLLKQVNLTWLVIDGLHAYEREPTLLNTDWPFKIRWIKPELPLPQLDAIMFGLHKTEGPVMIMDPDMSDNLIDLQRFQAIHECGADIVLGWRIKRTGISPLRRMLTIAFNRMAQQLLKLPLHDINTPMVSLTPTALKYLLSAPMGCPSPRLYAYHQLRVKLGETRIQVHELPNKKSAYTMQSRIRIGITRTHEMLAFWRYQKSLQKDL